jgi:hypothetical protein
MAGVMVIPMGKPTRSTVARPRQSTDAGTGIELAPLEARRATTTIARLTEATSRLEMPVPVGPNAGTGPTPVMKA